MVVIEPQCVGTFFPADAEQLRSQVEGLLRAARQAADSGRGKRQSGPAAKAIIVPHAGYGYSGAVAASAYAELADQRDAIRRVVLLGTCHAVRARGLLTTAADAMVTPLGAVPIDTEATARARRLPHVALDNWAHAADHALAVQLPFLQRALSGFRAVPFLVARCAAEDVAQVIEMHWGGEETLLVVSSDLSHYLAYDEAVERDRRTAEAVVALRPESLGRDDACGFRAIAGLLLAARARGLQGRCVAQRNSGDVTGDHDRVVGYGAFVFATAS